MSHFLLFSFWQPKGRQPVKVYTRKKLDMVSMITLTIQKPEYAVEATTLTVYEQYSGVLKFLHI